MEEEVSQISPDDAFWLLGDETRVAILRALWEHDGAAASFSELRDRLSNPDSGQFNYHLNKLVGVFLKHGQDGYELTQSGREVVRAIMAGTLTKQPELEPESIDGTCVHCGGELVAHYDGHGIIECGECGATVMWNEFPPAGIEGRSGEAFATAFDRWTQRRFQLAMDGVCPNCAAPMQLELTGTEIDATEDLASVHRCRNCQYEARVPLFGHVMDHPAVVSLFYQHGEDISERPYWWWRSLAEAFSVAVVSDDPWRAEIGIAVDDRSLTLTLDDTLDVIEVSES